MKELALHILDIAENAIKAEANLIEITIWEDIAKDLLTIEIKDNGIGMDEETVKKAENPFFTTRTTRKVGLGISLFKAAALQCDGSFKIYSIKGKGTTVTTVFKHSHIDRAPLGRIEDTLITLLMREKEIDYIYTHYYNLEKFYIDTREVKDLLKEVPITNLQVVEWLRQYIKEGLANFVKS
ncbi:ATP-binding protein [Clostridium formicaceticum]|uniref:histidine kinase n=1 Tax=Clostridium formicaceticum TaxID=1497 RepID=A0AAC9RL43_9CLOT|nr:ATP-binding protein [Clostridium formicaceticum]AOY76841.1 ATP-binding protein [Clostridium formicaceticum]ARE87318.1 Non-motile and phage-resistance protein [Clostridium formicaceticum]